VSVTGIVLAGGRSRRFGRDKLAADLGGEALLAATIAAVTGVADGVIVAGPELPDGFRAGEGPVALVRDSEPFAGPLAALANVLRWAVPDPGDVAIVVGGDMPRLVPAVLRLMLDVLVEDLAIDAVLLGRPGPSVPPDGGRKPRRPVLPLAVRVEVAARASTLAIAGGDRSMQSLVDRLRHVEIPAATWLARDPDASTLLDVDTQSDLERIRGRES